MCIIDQLECKHCHNQDCKLNKSAYVNKCPHSLKICKFGDQCIHLTQPKCIKVCVELNAYLQKYNMNKHISETKTDRKKEKAYNNILITYQNFKVWHRSCKNREECRSSNYLHYLKTGNTCTCDYDNKTRKCYGDKCKNYDMHSHYCKYYECKDCYDYNNIIAC